MCQKSRRIFIGNLSCFSAFWHESIVNLQKDENSNLKTSQAHYEDLKAKLESTKDLAERVKHLEAEMAKLREEKEELKAVVGSKNEELLGLAKLKEAEFMERRKAEEEKLVAEEARKLLAAEVEELKQAVQSELVHGLLW